MVEVLIVKRLPIHVVRELQNHFGNTNTQRSVKSCPYYSGGLNYYVNFHILNRSRY